MIKRMTLVAGIAALGFATLASASSETIISEWANVKTPPPPELRPVTVDPRDTALLVLDFTGAQDPAKGPCNRNKPRCIASIPVAEKLLAEARAKDMLVVYSVTSSGTAADIATALAPRPSEPVVSSGPDKFANTDLAKILTSKGIKTVIVTGTSAEGAVLDTATDAMLLKGMTAIVPVDTMSSLDPYAEQYVAWHLTHAPGVSQRSLLTRSDLLKF